MDAFDEYDGWKTTDPHANEIGKGKPGQPDYSRRPSGPTAAEGQVEGDDRGEAPAPQAGPRQARDVIDVERERQLFPSERTLRALLLAARHARLDAGRTMAPETDPSAAPAPRDDRGTRGVDVNVEPITAPLKGQGPIVVHFGIEEEGAGILEPGTPLWMRRSCVQAELPQGMVDDGDCQMVEDFERPAGLKDSAGVVQIGRVDCASADGEATPAPAPHESRIAGLTAGPKCRPCIAGDHCGPNGVRDCECPCADGACDRCCDGDHAHCIGRTEADYDFAGDRYRQTNPCWCDECQRLESLPSKFNKPQSCDQASGEAWTKHVELFLDK